MSIGGEGNSSKKKRQTDASAQEFIKLKNVRQNNLKGFDLDIPLGKLVVVTGLSGTGKSSLVFETLHAEGQRRYVETFSPYTRQFLELMDRPAVDSIENIRPSIAIQQTNTVKTSRSTVGTMTELCDFFKVWFCRVSELFDPETGEKVQDDNANTIWNAVSERWNKQSLLVVFTVKRPDKMSWEEIVGPVMAQGYIRCIYKDAVVRLEELDLKKEKGKELFIIQDRITVKEENKTRFIEALGHALHFGGNIISIYDEAAKKLGSFSKGLHSPSSGRTFMEPVPALFSFNSPIGACPTCRGFGKVVDLDYKLIIPDHSLSIEDGAIRCFHGEYMQNCNEELIGIALEKDIPVNIPWRDLTEKQKNFVINGDPEYGKRKKGLWYGIKGFFDWVDSKKYKAHMRFLAAKYKTHIECPECAGTRMQNQALFWKWKGYRLSDLYQLSLKELYALIKQNHKTTGNHPVDIAATAILSRLGYLNQVGLGYLTLDRQSRTLSGGEVERVNLTTCLGTSLVETLFVLDEPSVGLHARDMDRLIAILCELRDQGNTVVVVEHDEAVMRAADHIIEMGPEPGSRGGSVVYSGTVSGILSDKESITGAYLSGRKDVALPAKRRPVDIESKQTHINFENTSKHNIHHLSFKLPLQRLVCICGISGSGKSTLMDNIIYQPLMAKEGLQVEDTGTYDTIDCPDYFGGIVLVDQSPITKTPRSNAVLYCEAWETIRELFANSPASFRANLTASHFSFNSGPGRCEHCDGLGYEQVEMQFLSDVYVPCPVCEGKRFKKEVLEVTWNWKSISDVLAMDVEQAMKFFESKTKIHTRLGILRSVGLGYLTLGQPLNTLSGGESQRLKLVKHLSRIRDIDDAKLILLDEPTTGLHRDDVRKLIEVLQQLVGQGHSVVVVEHNMDVIKSADWVIEMGPEAGAQGGQIVAQGAPEIIAKGKTATAPFLKAALTNSKPEAKSFSLKVQKHFIKDESSDFLMAAEPVIEFKTKKQEKTRQLEVIGAREHNLKNIDIVIPHREITVLTGVSGSGKSSLAFDIIFAEGQRRFMESISTYARQFIEQMPKPDIDSLTGIAPTVAIEQRITRGSRKSTVSTITEVAQYLRLLYAKIGIQHSLHNGAPVIVLSNEEIFDLMDRYMKLPSKKDASHLYLSAPLMRARKGHHQPIAVWAQNQGFDRLYVDGKWMSAAHFEPLDRYKEHDIDVIIADFGKSGQKLKKQEMREKLDVALQLGKGTCYLRNSEGLALNCYSNQRNDPVTGEAYPELDPKYFSWNSPKGWCPTCFGQGYLYEDAKPGRGKINEEGELCPDCQGLRLNPVSRAVKIYLEDDSAVSLPEILQKTASEVIALINNFKLDRRGKQIIRDIIPQITERLKFMDQVGLNYLTLDRSSNTLSGGEAQRIRLASQLSSNLSGVLYVLDEPSIGLHARDNQRLIDSLKNLRDKGNTLLVVEHDEETMRQADHIIDLGPSAGIHGGELLACGSIKDIIANKNSLTGKYLRSGIQHPVRGTYRKLPAKKTKNEETPQWITLKECRLRNLKGDDLFIPLEKLTVVCGISGAGKSTLIRNLLVPSVFYAIEKNQALVKGEELIGKKLIPTNPLAKKEALPFSELINANVFKNVIEVDQEPIGKTPRSTPATYIGAFDIIRDYFTSLPEAKMHGYNATIFSFNTDKGRCEHCSGAGRIKLEMDFLPDTYVVCEQCKGSRYSSELLDVKWKGMSIADVLNMSFEEAVPFFQFHTRLHAILQLMVDTGLGYLRLGQSSPTLSGGEAQRLKLVSELTKGLPSFKERMRGTAVKNLYVLEEPTIGLHLSDCERLIHLLHRLVDQGHTVVVIEHHTDVIAEADYVIEVGPEGGYGGGEILYQGALSGLFKCKRSQTSKFLPVQK